MPRQSIRSAEHRARLAPRGAPYWETLYHGRAVGFRRGQKSGVWVVRYREGGRYRVQNLAPEGDLTYRQAVDAAMKAGAARSERYTVSDALDEYIQDYRTRSGRDSTMTGRIEKSIRPALGQFRLDELTSRHLVDWRNTVAGKARGSAARPKKATANRLLSIVKAALNHSYQQGRVDSDDAWRRVKPFPKVDAPKIHFLSPSEIRRLINACDADFRPLVEAALLTGCRYGEVIRLKASDYDADAGTIYLAETKSGKPRHVPLTEEGRRFFDSTTAGKLRGELVFNRADGAPWGKSHQQRPMMRACERSGIDPPISFHILRHCYGAALAREGVSLQVIAALLGHSDTRITERHYAHLQPSHVAEQLRANLPEIGIAASNVRKVG